MNEELNALAKTIHERDKQACRAEVAEAKLAIAVEALRVISTWHGLFGVNRSAEWRVQLAREILAKIEEASDETRKD